MNEPVLVDHAVLTPGVCGFCRTSEGPFVDTKNVLIPTCRYLCVKTCAHQVAELLGYSSPETVSILEDALDEMAAANEKTLAELESVKANMSVPLAEVIDFVAERAKRRPEVELETAS